MRFKRSYEEWIAELNEIIGRYRNAKITLEEALARMRKLGLTRGEAMRLLRSQEKPN